MKLTHQPPAWLRRVPRPPGGHALLAVPLFASPLAADSISQVLNNTTLWIIGILAGLATLMLTLGGVRYLLAHGDPGHGQDGEDGGAREDGGAAAARLAAGPGGAGGAGQPHPPTRDFSTATMTGARIASA